MSLYFMYYSAKQNTETRWQRNRDIRNW